MEKEIVAGELSRSCGEKEKRRGEEEKWREREKRKWNKCVR